MISPTSPRRRAETARRPHPGFAAHSAHGAFSLPASSPSVGNPKERTQSASRGMQHPGPRSYWDGGRDHFGTVGVRDRGGSGVTSAGCGLERQPRPAGLGRFRTDRRERRRPRGAATETAPEEELDHAAKLRRQRLAPPNRGSFTLGRKRAFAATQPYAGIQFAQICAQGVQQ